MGGCQPLHHRLGWLSGVLRFELDLQKIKMPHYSDIQSWIAGIIEILLFVDFLNYRFTGNSMLRSAVLTVDSKINEVADKVEMKVLGTSAVQRQEKEGGEMRRRRKGAEDDASPMEDV